jgi:XXXCH domain-containing protein
MCWPVTIRNGANIQHDCPRIQKVLIYETSATDTFFLKRVCRKTGITQFDTINSQRQYHELLGKTESSDTGMTLVIIPWKEISRIYRTSSLTHIGERVPNHTNIVITDFPPLMLMKNSDVTGNNISCIMEGASFSNRDTQLTAIITKKTMPSKDTAQTDNKNTLQGTLPADFTLLVVEDDQINQQVTVNMARQMGIKVAVASDGKRALRAAGKRKFDAVIIDITLPDINGIDLARKFRREPGYDSTPLIALTANTSIKGKCISSGMDDFLAKPVEPAILKATLLKWHNHYRNINIQDTTMNLPERHRQKSKKRPYEAKKLKKKFGSIWKIMEKAHHNGSVPDQKDVDELMKLSQEYGKMADPSWEDQWTRFHEMLERYCNSLLEGNKDMANMIRKDIKNAKKACHKSYK